MNTIVTTEIVAYNEFRAQLAELQEYNNAAVFDYNSAKGNKEARSHIHKLRKTKSAVDSCRKKEKAASLEYGRKVDSEAKEIISEIQEMIDVHLLPIQEIEEKEKRRVEKITSEIERIRHCCDNLDDCSAKTIEGILQVAQDIEITKEEFHEFTEQAIGAKSVSIATLKDALAAQQKYEDEQAELERLRKEAAERERKERERKIAQEAEERTKLKAEADARKAKEAADKRERALKEAAEKAKREKAEAEALAKERAKLAEQEKLAAEQRAAAQAKAAEDRAKRIAAETEARIKREAAQQAKAEAERKAKLEANKKHRAKIHNQALNELVKQCGLDESQAKAVIVEIASGKIPNVAITY